jgi:hypothetical protein
MDIEEAGIDSKVSKAEEPISPGLISIHKIDHQVFFYNVAGFILILIFPPIKKTFTFEPL